VSQVVVIAKAPVAGLAKTRLVPAVGAEGAAALAAAALLDTLEAAAEWADRRLLFLDGALADGLMAQSLVAAATSWTVVGQPAGGLGVRLAAAFAAAGALWGREPVLLIGMDTPQATPDDLERLDRARVGGSAGTAIGPALDGGWWGLALPQPSLGQVLVGVETSTDRTCDRTEAALSASGATVRRGASMRDMDTIDDARAIAETSPSLNVARALARLDTAAAAR
jgi:glycosyltransferase A (GT-A) superfamily protein (DUF2064 family)